MTTERAASAAVTVQEPAPRSEAVEAGARPRAGARGNRHLLRFDAFDRSLHVVMMTTFLGLAATGLPLLFSDERWAFLLVRVFGGFEAAGVLHRLCAVLMVGTFAAHLIRLGLKIVVHRDLGILWGPRSLVPQPRDAVEFFQHVRFFLGRGSRPRFGHWTYWEKFDYWAVFWGMAIIGGSGLMLWFPELFTQILPGWALNVAVVVHGEEALLAVVFIFTVHFFNSHLRPEKFPMDMVIFTGRVSFAELRHERPTEVEELGGEGGLADLDAGPPSMLAWRVGRVVGTLGVLIGLALAAMILFAVIRPGG